MTAEYIHLSFYCQNGQNWVYLNVDCLWFLFFTMLCHVIGYDKNINLFLHSSQSLQSCVKLSILVIAFLAIAIFWVYMDKNIKSYIGAVVIIASLITTVSVVHIDVWGLDDCPVWPLRKRSTYVYVERWGWDRLAKLHRRLMTSKSLLKQPYNTVPCVNTGSWK